MRGMSAEWREELLRLLGTLVDGRGFSVVLRGTSVNLGELSVDRVGATDDCCGNINLREGLLGLTEKSFESRP